ncbi:MAG: hypothetical protein ACKVP0_28110 [Pirellulaceae bacterium]
MVSRLLILTTLEFLTSGCTSPVAAIPEGTTVVYEGLPHTAYEGDLFESEKNKPTAVLHGLYFYREYHTLSGKEAETLRTALSDASGFSPWSGEKKCGGFHADYAVAWKEDGKTFEVLICFGCGEVKRYGTGKEIREDMKKETSDEFNELLKAYDKLRPAHQGWGP